MSIMSTRDRSSSLEVLLKPRATTTWKSWCTYILTCDSVLLTRVRRAVKISGAKVLSNGIEKMEDAPGGGYIVTLADPEGFPINIVYGQTPRKADAMPTKLSFNLETEKRRVREFARFKPGPAAVHKVRCSCTRLVSTRIRSDSIFVLSLVITGLSSAILTPCSTSTRRTSTLCRPMFCTLTAMVKRST